MSSGSPASKARLSKGFSLLEVMLGAGLLLLLGTILVTVLVPSFRAVADNQKRVSMRQKAVVVFERIADDLQDAVPSALSISTSPPVIAGQPLQEFTSTGTPQYAARFWVYYLAGQELRRLVWENPGPPSLSVTPQAGTPGRLPQTDLDKFSTTVIPKARSLTDQISSFQISHAGVGSSVAGPITLDLILGGTTSEPARVEMRRVFSPRLGE